MRPEKEVHASGLTADQLYEILHPHSHEMSFKKNILTEDEELFQTKGRTEDWNSPSLIDDLESTISSQDTPSGKSTKREEQER